MSIDTEPLLSLLPPSLKTTIICLSFCSSTPRGHFNQWLRRGERNTPNSPTHHPRRVISLWGDASGDRHRLAEGDVPRTSRSLADGHLQRVNNRSKRGEMENHNSRFIVGRFAHVVEISTPKTKGRETCVPCVLHILVDWEIQNGFCLPACPTGWPRVCGGS